MGLSGREAAKKLGLTQPALVKASRTGRITREPDGTYDVEKVRKQLAQNSNALKRRTSPKKAAKSDNQSEAAAITSLVATPITEEPESESDNRTLAEAQRQREWVRVEKDKLSLERERAQLAPIGEINAWVAGMIIRSREILLRIAPELKDRLAQQANPHECEKLVDTEVRRALNELAEFKPAA